MFKVPVTIQYHELLARLPSAGTDNSLFSASYRRMDFLRKLIISGACIHLIVDAREPEIIRRISSPGRPHVPAFGIYMQCEKITYIQEDGTERILKDRGNVKERTK